MYNKHLGVHSVLVLFVQ